ncbi:MAG: hypothetical protein ABW252_16780 [Polyangiales bacterium]
MATTEPEELQPARPDVRGERPTYLPRLPWRWILSIGLFLTLSIGTCQIRDRQETEALRATVLKAYGDQLGPVAARYQKLVATIRDHTVAAGKRDAPETHADPRLAFASLGTTKGVYLRLPAANATDPKQIAGAAAELPPDAIGRCLGVAPASAAELMARGSFLEKEWIQRAHDADSVLKLRVVAEELRQRGLRDLPMVAEAVSAGWFMLVLERGDNRRDAPVDVYLWELATDKLLLSSRIKAEGGLVAARIAVGGVKPGRYADQAQTGAAQDCSIASQLKALVGEATAQRGSKP